MKNQSFLQRLRFAWSGVIEAIRSEASFRAHLLATAGVVVILSILRPPAHWWAIVAVTIAVVLATELLNTAVEALADHLHPEIHPRIRIVKDCAAAAVLMVSLGAIAVAIAFLVDML